MSIETKKWELAQGGAISLELSGVFANLSRYIYTIDQPINICFDDKARDKFSASYPRRGRIANVSRYIIEIASISRMTCVAPFEDVYLYPSLPGLPFYVDVLATAHPWAINLRAFDAEEIPRQKDFWFRLVQLGQTDQPFEAWLAMQQTFTVERERQRTESRPMPAYKPLPPLRPEEQGRRFF